MGDDGREEKKGRRGRVLGEWWEVNMWECMDCGNKNFISFFLPY